MAVQLLLSVLQVCSRSDGHSQHLSFPEGIHDGQGGGCELSIVVAGSSSNCLGWGLCLSSNQNECGTPGAGKRWWPPGNLVWPVRAPSCTDKVASSSLKFLYLE